MNIQTIDNELIDNHNADYTFSHGANFGPPTRILVSGFILLSLNGIWGAINIEMYLGIVFLLVVIAVLLFFLTAYSGVQLCVRTKYIRMYSTYLGFKYGKWKTTRNYTDISILTIRKKVTKGTLFNSNGITVNEKDTGVYLLIPSHRKRQLIAKCKNKTEAEKLAVELSKKLDKNYVVFSPQISEATKARRYR